MWACAAPTETVTGAAGSDGPVATFLRQSAASSQNARNYAASVNSYQSLYVRDPGDIDALLGLARNLRYIGSAGQAVELLENASAEHRDRLDLRAELGKAQLGAGSTEEAISTLTDVAERQPGDWQVLSALGIAYDLLGNFAEAQARYGAALAVSPNNLSVLNNLGLSKTLSGDLDGGITILQRAVARPLARAQVRQNLALLHAMKGDVITAERLLRQDLPEEMVEHNLKYYMGLRPGATSSISGGVQGVRQSARAFATPSPGPPAVAIEVEEAPEAPPPPPRAHVAPRVDHGADIEVASPSETAAAPGATPEAPVTATVEATAAAAAEAAIVPAPAPEADKAPEAVALLPEARAEPLAEQAVVVAETAAAAAEAAIVPETAPEAAVIVAALEEAGPAGGGPGAISVQFGVFPTEERAREMLRALRDAHVDLLSGLEFDIARIDAGGLVAGYRLLAGPMASEALAADVCTKLHSRSEGCTLVTR